MLEYGRGGCESDFPYEEYPLAFPGSSEEPGHRNISDSGVGDEHIVDNAKDTTSGITTIRYIFRNVYGSIPDNQGGQQLAFNLITNAQKQRRASLPRGPESERQP